MVNTNNQSPSVVEAPSRSIRAGKQNLFLAGGITNCPNWQAKFIEYLKGYPDLNIFNPRRSNYPMDDPAAAEEQIKWEYDFLKSADAIVVWFSRGSLNPITLYELGLWVNARPELPAFVGIDPGYERAQDVIIQTRLTRPEIKIVDTLEALALQITTRFLN